MENIINFMAAIGKLKDTQRTGWVTRTRVKEPESIADHSFACAILAMCLGDLNGLDTDKLVRMLLLHDIQEAVTGDLDYETKKELGASKVRQIEKSAIETVLSVLPQEIRESYFSIWNEFDDQKTPEALLAKDIDKLEMTIQALEYENKGYNSNKFDVFWENGRDSIRTPLAQELLKILFTRRRNSKKAQLSDWH